MHTDADGLHGLISDDDTWSGSEGGSARGLDASSSCIFGSMSDWFGRKQSDIESRLQEEIQLLKRENRQLRDLAKRQSASITDMRQATETFEPLAPLRCSSLQSKAEGTSVNANPMVIITDAGRSLEDELTLVLLRAFAERGLVQLQAVVANVSPALARARLTRGTLDTLGLYNVPVGVGTDGGTGAKGEDTWSSSAEQYVPREQSQSAKALLSGRRLLHQTFVRARANSLTLLLLSSTKDAALFFRDNPELFRSKIKTVVFSGGAKVPCCPVGVEAKTIEPDESSSNVAIDVASARFLFRRLQELGVPLIVLGQGAAHAAPTPRHVFDQLAELGSPIGCRLRSSQKIMSMKRQ